MKKIPLSRGMFAIVDDEDYAYISQHRWYVHTNRSNKYLYARRTSGSSAILMHREIKDVNCGVIDHLNGNGLDNRRENLRLATYRQNQANSGKRVNNKSGYKGVYLSRVKSGSKVYSYWKADIQFNKKKIHLGCFKNRMEAALKYDTKALEIYGEYAKLNFSK